MKTIEKKINLSDVGVGVGQVGTAVNDEVAKVSLGIGGVVTGIIGLWAVVCMVGGLAKGGVVEIIKGYITAITG